jgi:SAM-dependent methyltransferase
MLAGDRCQAYDRARKLLEREFPPHPFGGCVLPIVEGYLPLIERGMRVLEIGPGTWDLIQRHCRRVGAEWEGVDASAEYYGRKTIATRIENLAELSFADEQFDLVCGNQTIHQWGEHGCSFPWGLYQCFRVCKPGGRVCMNFPVHFQGTWEFLLGDTDEIRRVFGLFSDQVVLYRWGDPAEPLPQYFAHPRYGRLKRRPAYIIDVQALRDRPLPQGMRNDAPASGWRTALRVYPLTYNVHRLLKRVGLR